MYLFLLGPQVRVKGLYLNLCVKNLVGSVVNWNLCRKHIAEQTEIGKQIDFAIKSGKLVSDEPYKCYG